MLAALRTSRGRAGQAKPLAPFSSHLEVVSGLYEQTAGEIQSFVVIMGSELEVPVAQYCR